jgi:hypothetical protein
VWPYTINQTAQPTGPDIARELEAFITAVRAVPVA